MKSIIAFLFILLALATSSPSMSSEIPHLENGPHPTQTIRNWHLKEEWRAGPEGGEFLFGRIGDVEVDSVGHTYLLDYQQQATYVFDPTGKFMHTRGRKGEGPGETTMASRLLVDGNRLGLLNRFPAEIVWLDSSGDPAGTLTPVMPDTPEAILGAWFGRLRHGRTYLALTESSFTEGGVRNVNHIGECNPDGMVTNVSVTFGDDVYTHGFQDDIVDESQYFNPMEGRWDVDRHGRTWLALKRDSYLLEVRDPNGAVILTTTREFQTPLRSAQHVQKIRTALENRWGNTDSPIVVGDSSPCINKLWIMENPWGDEVWIESAASHHDLPPGVMVRYDLFNLDGSFTHQVDIVGDGDPLFDKWYLVGKNRLIMVRNASSGGFSEDDENNPRFDDDALEVISFRIVWEE